MCDFVECCSSYPALLLQARAKPVASHFAISVQVSCQRILAHRTKTNLLTFPFDERPLSKGAGGKTCTRKGLVSYLAVFQTWANKLGDKVLLAA